MASAAPAIPLRFQRQELQLRANLSKVGQVCLAKITGPQELIATLGQLGEHQDAIGALAMMLPRRQAVWWGCLCMRLLPDLPNRPAELLAVETAESWIQSQSEADAERAGTAAEMCALDSACGYVAMAAYWAGPSLAPRGQQAVPPPPYLAGVAVRAALLLAAVEPSVEGRLTLPDFLGIGTAIMHGDLGRKAQATVRDRLAAAG